MQDNYAPARDGHTHDGHLSDPFVSDANRAPALHSSPYYALDQDLANWPEPIIAPDQSNHPAHPAPGPETLDGLFEPANEPTPAPVAAKELHSFEHSEVQPFEAQTPEVQTPEVQTLATPAARQRPARSTAAPAKPQPPSREALSPVAGRPETTDKSSRTSSLRTALWGLSGFVLGVVFWHLVGFWSFVSTVVLPPSSEVDQGQLPYASEPRPPAAAPNNYIGPARPTRTPPRAALAPPPPPPQPKMPLPGWGTTVTQAPPVAPTTTAPLTFPLTSQSSQAN